MDGLVGFRHLDYFHSNPMLREMLIDELSGMISGTYEKDKHETIPSDRRGS